MNQVERAPFIAAQWEPVRIALAEFGESGQDGAGLGELSGYRGHFVTC